MRKEEGYQFGEILAVSTSLLVYLDTHCVLCVFCGGIVSVLDAVAAAPDPSPKSTCLAEARGNAAPSSLTLTLPSLEEKPTFTTHTRTRTTHTHAIQNRHPPLPRRAPLGQAAGRPKLSPNFCSTKNIVLSFAPLIQAP